MKHLLTYLIGIITFTSLPICTESNFWTTLKKDMGSMPLFFANQEGALFDRLPEEIKNAGKQIVITMPDCKNDTIVQITYPGIADIGKYSITQVVTLTPTKKSETIQIPKPFNDNDQNLLVEIVQKTKAYTDYHSFFKTHDIKNLTPEEETLFHTLSDLYNKTQRNIIQLNYRTLTNNQTVTLPYPAENKPTVNYLNDHIVANLDGAVFNALPDSIKESGKHVILSIPDCGKDICVTIRQTIKARPDLGLVSQVVIFTKKIHEIRVNLPEIQDRSQEIMIQTAANKDIKKFNKNFRKYHNKMHRLSDAQRKTIFKEYPENFNNYKYAELNNDQIIQLSCPTKTFLQQL